MITSALRDARFSFYSFRFSNFAEIDITDNEGFPVSRVNCPRPPILPNCGSVCELTTGCSCVLKSSNFLSLPDRTEGGGGGGVRVSARIRTYAETAKAISRALRRVRYGSATSLRGDSCSAYPCRWFALVSLVSFYLSVSYLSYCRFYLFSPFQAYQNPELRQREP